MSTSSDGTGNGGAAAGAAAAAGTAGQAAGAAAQNLAPQAGSGGAAAPADWTTGLSDDLKGFVTTKGFSAPKDVLESYRNLEKLNGAPEHIIKVPKEADSPEWRAIWERLGAPKEAKDYQLEVPAEIGDKALADWAKEEFHKLGVPRKMAEGYIKAWNEKMVATHKANVEQAQLTIKQAGDNLAKAWGNAFEQNKGIADQAARRLEMTPEEVAGLTQALGPEKALKALHKIGTAVGEHGFINGQNAGSAIMTPQQAQSRVKDLRQDKDFVARLENGDTNAKDQWQRAHEMAYPGEVSI